jgi:hypothetical protein
MTENRSFVGQAILPAAAFQAALASALTAPYRKETYRA